MNTNLGGNKTEQRLSLTFCKWCNRVIHRSAVDRLKSNKNFCDTFCQDEFNFNRDLKNKYLGKYNLIDQDSIAEELREKGIIDIQYAKENNIPSKHFAQYIHHLMRDGFAISVSKVRHSGRNRSRNVYKLVNS